eukprot:3717968-Alexandrium_andersonii.AAC.1
MRHSAPELDPAEFRAHGARPLLHPLRPLHGLLTWIAVAGKSLGQKNKRCVRACACDRAFVRT